MPSSNPKQRYKDIIKSISDIYDDLSDMKFEDLLKDGKTFRSVVYSLQTISEAAVKLGYHAEEHASNVDWRSIRGFGNISRHDYGEVSPVIIWETVHNDLPILVTACQNIIEKLENSPNPDGSNPIKGKL